MIIVEARGSHWHPASKRLGQPSAPGMGDKPSRCLPEKVDGISVILATGPNSIPDGSRHIAVVPRLSEVPTPRTLHCSQIPLRVGQREMRDKVSKLNSM